MSIASAQEASGFLKALAHEARLLIFRRLIDEEKSVTAIKEILSLRQPAILQQLARLRVEIGSGRDRGVKARTFSIRLLRLEVREVIGALHRAFLPQSACLSAGVWRFGFCGRAREVGRAPRSLAACEVGFATWFGKVCYYVSPVIFLPRSAAKRTMWSDAGIDPSLAARSLWSESPLLQVGQEEPTSSDRQGPEPQAPAPLQV